MLQCMASLNLHLHMGTTSQYQPTYICPASLRRSFFTRSTQSLVTKLHNYSTFAKIGKETAIISLLWNLRRMCAADAYSTRRSNCQIKLSTSTSALILASSLLSTCLYPSLRWHILIKGQIPLPADWRALPSTEGLNLSSSTTGRFNAIVNFSFSRIRHTGVFFRLRLQSWSWNSHSICSKM